MVARFTTTACQIRPTTLAGKISGSPPGHGGAEVVSTSVFDYKGGGRLDLLLGGYDSELVHRGVQLLVNAGNRAFVDETRRRIGASAWSLTEEWH